MAENEKGQEKTEDATAKKEKDSREKGQVPRSREFNTFFMMLASGVALIYLGGDIVDGLLGVLKDNFIISRNDIFDKNYMLSSFWASVIASLKSLTSLFIVMTFIAIASSLTIGGWNFAWKAIAPKGSKLNPLSGLKRIFGSRGLMELWKALAKFFVVVIVAGLLLYHNADKLMIVGRQDVEVALANIGSELLWYFLFLSLSLLVIAVVDAPFQIWDNKQQMKMSKDEVKQEFKSQEGSPETRQRIRQAQRDIAMRRMMEDVPDADVVITNPTHYAVAIKYDADGGGAPRVVAKGSDLIAMRIRLIASENKVPQLSSPALARAIYYSTELDQEIPAGLYMAVAQVLAFIFRLKEKPGTDFSSPLVLDDVPIPDDLRRDE